MSKLHISSTPHIHQKGSSTRNIMLDVVIAMLPATIAGIVIFGISALWTVLSCVISAVVAEYVFNLCVGKKQTIGDLSAVVTGLLLALNVSTAVPLWQCVVGSVFAIVVVKCLFGGIGKNIVNPAITARVFMLLTFGAVGAVALPTVVEITTGATPLAALNQGAEVAAAEAPSLMDLFLGLHGGAIGETCILALIIGFVYLLVRKVITWHTPVVFIATVFVLYLAFTGDVMMAVSQILAGGLFIGAIFMATDYVTTPITTRGRVVFALGCGVITFIIRYFCA